MFTLIILCSILATFKSQNLDASISISTSTPTPIAITDNDSDGSWTGMFFKGAKKTFTTLFAALGSTFEVTSGNGKALSLSVDEINTLLISANNLINAGEITKSMEHLVTIYESNPDHQETCSLLGGLLMSLEEHGLATDILYNAIQLSSWTDSVSVANFAEILRKEEDYELGLKVLFRGLKARNNTDETGLLSRSAGNLFVGQKNYTMAADWFLSAAMKNPTNIQDWAIASTMLFPRSGHDYIFAENVLLQAVQSNPASPVLYYQLGLVMHFTEREQEAISLYRESLRLQDENNPAISSLATALHAVGDLDNALLEYQKAAIIDPNNSIMLVNYGKLMLSLENKQGCLGLALKAIDVSPEVPNPEAVKLAETCR